MIDYIAMVPRIRLIVRTPRVIFITAIIAIDISLMEMHRDNIRGDTLVCVRWVTYFDYISLWYWAIHYFRKPSCWHFTTHCVPIAGSISYRAPVNRSSLAQVMVCFVMAPSLNRPWLTTNVALWKSPKNNFTWSIQDIVSFNEFEKHSNKVTSTYLMS